MGTAATIRSGAYEKEILKHGADMKIISRACPLLVPLVENGRTAPGDRLANLAVGEYLEDISPLKPAAVILGCTHYPLLAAVFSAFLPDSALINSAAEAACFLNELIQKSRFEDGGLGKRTFFVTDDTESFSRNAKAFLGQDISDKVIKISIEE